MKRVLCLLLCAVAVFSFCACGKDKPKNDPKKSTPAQVAPTTPAETEETDALGAAELSDTARLKEFIRTFDKTPTAEQQVLISDDDVEISLNALAYDRINGPELQLRVTNRMNKALIMQCPYTVVNGHMITPDLDMTIPAGKTAEGVLNISYFYLAINGVNSIRHIELPFTFSDTQTYELVKTTETASIVTSAEQTDDEPFEEEGQVAYDKGGVKIVIKGLNSDHTYSKDEKLVVAIYNGSDKEIVVKPKEAVVNGYNDLIPMMHRNILPGKQATDVVILPKSDLSEHSISDIDSIDISFVIFHTDPWKEIASTELISVDLSVSETIKPATPDAAAN